jgi:hypothetical protein
MSSLLSPLVSRQTPDERIGLEKQVQRLSEMLHESEDKVIALRSQEKVLCTTSLFALKKKLNTLNHL